MLSEKMHKALEYVRDAKGVRTQKEFALAVGMSADRLRNVVNDKIKKLQPDEAVSIERAFGIRSAWWFTAVAPMLLTDEELNVQAQLNEVRNASAEVLALGLIATHPDKAALLRKLEKVALAADALALNETLMSDEAVNLARQEAQEWIGLARDELARTDPQKPRA